MPIVKKYLGNRVIALDSLSEIEQGEIYIVGYGKQAFRAFKASSDGKPERVNFNNISIYEVHLDDNGGKIEDSKIVFGNLSLDDFIDLKILGVYKVDKENGLYKELEEKLK